MLKVHLSKENISGRNFATISPSAKLLLLLKGYTNIPFARQTAELLVYPEKFIPEFRDKDITFWARVVHFEARYRSIDQLLADLPVKNILELSSGYSFRSLEMTKKRGFFYIDTDLPEVIKIKKDLIKTLRNENSGKEGELELVPLNCLDEEQFTEIISRFPAGEIAIINEGLLMYLNLNEKEKLCNIISKILKERGGYWITADIYLKKKHDKAGLKIEDKTQKFFSHHNIEENKFENFEAAEAFFRKMGFIIDKEADRTYSDLSTIKYFLKSVNPDQLSRIRKTGKIQVTWRLRVANVPFRNA